MLKVPGYMLCNGKGMRQQFNTDWINLNFLLLQVPDGRHFSPEKLPEKFHNPFLEVCFVNSWFGQFCHRGKSNQKLSICLQ